MKRHLANIWKKIKRLVVIAFFVHLAYLLLLLVINPPITITMLANLLNGYSVRYQPVSFEQQGYQIHLAAIAGEDQKFPNHFGLDISAIKGAYEKNKQGKKIRGGSTITQQTSKNVFFWQGRDWIRKTLEVYSSFLTEIVWGKKRILKHYLNVAEMGEGIYGVQAASLHYFNKSAKNLSADQAALLIASLPSPKKTNPAKNSGRLRSKQRWILRQMRNLAGDKEVKELLSN